MPASQHTRWYAALVSASSTGQLPELLLDRERAVVGLEPADLAELTPRHGVTQRGGVPEPKRSCDGLRVHRPSVPHPPLLVVVAVIGEAGLPSMRVPRSGVILERRAPRL